jgi:hypothetical protein
MHEQIVFADCWKALTQYRRGRYICPACAGHNLTFSRSGAWNCWNDPSRTHRLEIMAALGVKLKRSIPQPEPEYDLNIAPNIHPAQLGFPLVRPGKLLVEVEGNRTHYLYGNCQRVVRIDLPGDKIVYPQHRSGNIWVNGAGSRPWLPYGLSRYLPYPGKTNLILIVEGQKCVEIAHQRGIPTLCLESGDYSQNTIFDKLRAVKNRFERVLLVLLPDNDLAGNRKAQRIIHTARYFSLPTLLLDPIEIESGLIVGGDIEQMVDFNADRFTGIVRQMLSTRSIDHPSEPTNLFNYYSP